MSGSRNRLKDCVIINATFPQYDDDDDDDNEDNNASNLMQCSCAEFDETKACAHLDTIRSTQGVVLKIRSVLHRCSHRIIDDGIQDEWLLTRIPVCEGECTGLGLSTSRRSLELRIQHHPQLLLIAGQSA